MLERKFDSSRLSFISDIAALTTNFFKLWSPLPHGRCPFLSISHQDDLSRSPSGIKARSSSGENEEEGPSDQIQISKELFLLVIQAGLLNNDGLGT